METSVIRVYSLCTSNYPFPRTPPVTYPFPHVRSTEALPFAKGVADRLRLSPAPPLSSSYTSRRERKKERRVSEERQKDERGWGLRGFGTSTTETLDGNEGEELEGNLVADGRMETYKVQKGGSTNGGERQTETRVGGGGDRARLILRFNYFLN